MPSLASRAKVDAADRAIITLLFTEGLFGGFLAFVPNLITLYCLVPADFVLAPCRLFEFFVRGVLVKIIIG